MGCTAFVRFAVVEPLVHVRSSVFVGSSGDGFGQD